MKSFAPVLRRILAVIAIGFVIAVFAFVAHARSVDKAGAAYVKANVPKIVDQWNLQNLMDHATPGLQASEKATGNIEKAFVALRKFGALKQIEKLKGNVTSATYTDDGPISYGNYSINTDFEKGTAVVRLQLVRVADGWQVNQFKIESSILPKTPAPEPVD